MYEPLKIRAYLQTGIISDQFLPFDSILYYHIVRERFGSEIISKPNESTIPENSDISLPFTIKLKGQDCYFYSCSFAQWSPDMVEDQQAYCKRFDLKYSNLIDFQGKRAKIETARGRYKNYHIKVYYRAASWVEWYAHGWKKDIEKYLPFITHIGKKTSQGWGAVLKWEIDIWKDDWSVRGENNKLMRAVPVKENGYLYGIRPSYWLPKHHFFCKMP